MKRNFLCCAWLLTVLPLLVACFRNDELRWTEEVQLPDGKAVIVKRVSQFKGPHELGQSPSESWYSMDFEHPASKEKIHVESALFAGGLEMEQAAQQKKILLQWPVALMLNNQDLYLVMWSHSLYHGYLLCPDPPLQLYKWKNAKWEWRPLTEIPIRKFKVAFVRGLSDPEKQERIRRSKSYITVNMERVDRRVVYDLTGMTQVTYEASRMCQRYRDWFPFLLSDKPLNN